VILPVFKTDGRSLRTTVCSTHTRFRQILLSGLGFLITISPSAALSQVQAEPANPPFSFRVPVDEISLRFHASDQSGKPLTQLSIPDLTLSDDGKPEHQILALQPLDNLPIRGGILVDVSASVLRDLYFYRSIVELYASRLLRKDVDKFFVTQFDRETRSLQDWTGSGSAITAGVAGIGPRPDRYEPLTAIFDSLYTTCRDLWSKQSENTGNFILLFTDGEDDASHVYLKEAVDMCQRSHVTIYVFDSSRSGHRSDGYHVISDLAMQTGGRAFIHPRSEDIWRDLQLIEQEQRNQYLLVYKPTSLVADGSFHRIRLQCSVPESRIVTRSGYYAFPRP
jgi:Ca-activated chloride channel homolog